MEIVGAVPICTVWSQCSIGCFDIRRTSRTLIGVENGARGPRDSCCGMGVIFRHSGHLEYGKASLMEDIVGSETTIGLGFTVQQVVNPDKSPYHVSRLFSDNSLWHIQVHPLRNSPSLPQPPSLVQVATVTHTK